MGEVTEAFEDVTPTISIDDAYGRPHTGLAEIYLYQLNKLQRAIRALQTALQFEIRPYGLDRLRVGLARALEAVGHTAEARQRYQAYLDRFPWGEQAQKGLLRWSGWARSGQASLQHSTSVSLSFCFSVIVSNE